MLGFGPVWQRQASRGSYEQVGWRSAECDNVCERMCLQLRCWNGGSGGRRQRPARDSFAQDEHSAFECSERRNVGNVRRPLATEVQEG